MNTFWREYNPNGKNNSSRKSLPRNVDQSTITGNISICNAINSHDVEENYQGIQLENSGHLKRLWNRLYLKIKDIWYIGFQVTSIDSIKEIYAQPEHTFKSIFPVQMTLPS